MVNIILCFQDDQKELPKKFRFSRIFVVHDMSLSHSSLPYEGVVQITTGSGTKNVCWQTLKNGARDTVCRHLGYYKAYSLVNVSVPTDAKHATFSGSINCHHQGKYLSQCATSFSSSKSCSGLSYIHCVTYGKT